MVLVRGESFVNTAFGVATNGESAIESAVYSFIQFIHGDGIAPALRLRDTMGTPCRQRQGDTWYPFLRR